MRLEIISCSEYFDILRKYHLDIPIYSDIEASEIYLQKEFLRVSKNDNDLAVMMVPIDNNGVRREYRYFPYVNPIFIKKESNITKKNILKLIFNYLFNKYDYCFIPLHPTFKLVSSIQSEGGFVEMRHTHVTNKKLTLDNISSKLRNHISNARNQVEIVIDTNFEDFDFKMAIKGSSMEVEKRSNLAKKILSNGKGIVVKAVQDGYVKAGIICIYDKEWAYLLHSYQDKSIRGVIPLLILEANEYLFDKIQVHNFDFEGSVINDIDDFFSTFNVEILNYPFVISAKSKEKFYQLVERSMKIEGRVKYYEYN